MSSVLDRSALAESPLADLHLLANELGVDGFRRLRKLDLIDAILAKQAGDDLARPEGGDSDDAPSRSRRGRRGGGAPAAAPPRPARGAGRGGPPPPPPRAGAAGDRAAPAEKEEKPAEDKEV